MSIEDDTAANFRRKLTSAITRRLGLNERIAAPIADEVVEALREMSPGSHLYIPARDKTARNDAIRQRFNGRNHAEVCREFNISRRQVYNILKKEGETA